MNIFLAIIVLVFAALWQIVCLGDAGQQGDTHPSWTIIKVGAVIALIIFIL